MHPAFSVIFFTVTSGAGYGLIALLCFLNFINQGIFVNKELFLIFSAVSVGIFSVGLISSTFHLANPKNAWRAFMRFRTSWLAREGLLAILFYPILFTYLYFIYQNTYSSNLLFMQFYSFLIFIFSVFIIFCTGMIYACLKTIPQWNTILTPINYIVIGLYLGFLLVLFLLSINSYGVNDYKYYILCLIAFSFIMKLIYYYKITPSRHNINEATNAAIKIKNSNVRLLDVGHTGGTFLTDEFCFFVAEKKLKLVKLFSIFFGFVAPFMLISSYYLLYNDILVIFLALLVSFFGIIAERWLFFAQAKHVVNLYHGSQTV